MEAVYKEEAAKPYGVMMLALNIRQSSQALEEFARTSGYTMPILMDPGGYTAYAYGVSGIPSTFFIDGKGIIRAVKYGPFISVSEIKQKLEKLKATS